MVDSSVSKTDEPKRSCGFESLSRHKNCFRNHSFARGPLTKGCVTAKNYGHRIPSLANLNNKLDFNLVWVYFTLMSRLERLLNQTPKNRGRIAEAIARQALDLMQDGGQIASHWPANWVEDHYQHFDEVVQDCKGNEFEMGFGSSEFNRSQDSTLYPYIRHLVIQPGETPEQVIPKIVALLGLEVYV